jgi:hypothetical protein
MQRDYNACDYRACFLHQRCIVIQWNFSLLKQVDDVFFRKIQGRVWTKKLKKYQLQSNFHARCYYMQINFDSITSVNIVATMCDNFTRILWSSMTSKKNRILWCKFNAPFIRVYIMCLRAAKMSRRKRCERRIFDIVNL